MTKSYPVSSEKECVLANLTHCLQLRYLAILILTAVTACDASIPGAGHKQPSIDAPIAKTKIVFATWNNALEQAGIFTVNADGTGLQQLTENGASPSWSPSADQIAYEAGFENRTWLFVVNTDGTNNKRIANLGTAPFEPPAWSPDGQQLATVWRRPNDCCAPMSIHIISLDAAKEIEVSCSTSRSCSNPTWSPDMNYLVFSYIPGEDKPSNIGLVDLTKGNSLQTLQTTAAYPRWQPQDDKIAFYARQRDKTGIFVASLLNTQLNLVVEDNLPQGLVWSPDGTRLAFFSIRDTNDKSDIYIINADGSDLTRLTDDPASDISPSWSPDSNELAFSSNREGHFEVYAINADGTNLRQLTNSLYDKIEPVWAPR